MQRQTGFRALWMTSALVATLAALAIANPGTPEGRTLPEARDGHRALRDNAPTGMPVPTEPERFTGFPDAPAFSVVPRQHELTLFPCAACHDPMPTNTEPRKLMAPHPAALAHGGGRFWCLDCHALENRNALQLLTGEEAGFDEAWKLCGQCHYQPQKDWAHGAHGKRVADWRGERVLWSCTHCHDPHDPGIAPRAPEPPPPVRHGLAPMQTADHGDVAGSTQTEGNAYDGEAPDP